MVCEVSAGWKNDSLQERNVGDGSGGSEQSKRRAEEQAGGDAEIGETAEAVAGEVGRASGCFEKRTATFFNNAIFKKR